MIDFYFFRCLLRQNWSVLTVFVCIQQLSSLCGKFIQNEQFRFLKMLFARNFVEVLI